MNKYHNSFWFFLFFCTLTSCSHSIKIDLARHSSELNHCEIAFGEDLTTLKYENAILLQTGLIDTTTEQAPISVAIVIIAKKEVILTLVNHHEVENETSRAYEREGYRLSLSYKKEVIEHNETIFRGKFLIENKNLKSEYDVVGTVCNL